MNCTLLLSKLSACTLHIQLHRTNFRGSIPIRVITSSLSLRTRTISMKMLSNHEYVNSDISAAYMHQDVNVQSLKIAWMDDVDQNLFWVIAGNQSHPLALPQLFSPVFFLSRSVSNAGSLDRPFMQAVLAVGGKMLLPSRNGCSQACDCTMLHVCNRLELRAIWVLGVAAVGLIHGCS